MHGPARSNHALAGWYQMISNVTTFEPPLVPSLPRRGRSKNRLDRARHDRQADGKVSCAVLGLVGFLGISHDHPGRMSFLEINPMQRRVVSQGLELASPVQR